MLLAKFGRLSVEHEARLTTASDEELDAMADRILDAETPGAVFDGQ